MQTNIFGHFEIILKISNGVVNHLEINNGIYNEKTKKYRIEIMEILSLTKGATFSEPVLLDQMLNHDFHYLKETRENIGDTLYIHYIFQKLQ